MLDLRWTLTAGRVGRKLGIVYSFYNCPRGRALADGEVRLKEQLMACLDYKAPM